MEKDGRKVITYILQLKMKGEANLSDGEKMLLMLNNWLYSQPDDIVEAVKSLAEWVLHDRKFRKEHPYAW